MARERIHFVTGRLAEQALRHLLQSVAEKAEFEFTVQVMPITVAALMTTDWIAARLVVPPGATSILLPGYCEGDLSPIADATPIPAKFGPKDLRRLPAYFGSQLDRSNYGVWDIEIIAEINEAPRLEFDRILAMAAHLRDSGADIIDVGCLPGSRWTGVGNCVRALKDQGHRISIDSLDVSEIEIAVDEGAELVLSVNSSNRHAASDWGCPVVLIPDEPTQFQSLADSIELMATRNVPFRIDPILEPIGLGFTSSLGRYIQARQRWPDAEMMMGIGNLTELTDVDSAGVNVVLLAICQELGIRSVLTTEVINWARSSVKECDLARRLVHFAVSHRLPPKHVSDQLIVLRDLELLEFGADQIRQLSSLIKDHNYRVLAEDGKIHLLGSEMHLFDPDPFIVFDELQSAQPRNLNASHAFYLGYEMCKAAIALQLGKQYTQDESLNWGHLSNIETTRHRLKIGN